MSITKEKGGITANPTSAVDVSGWGELKAMLKNYQPIAVNSLIAKMLLEHLYEGQRPRSPGNLRKIRHSMKDHDFRPGTVLVLGKINGSLWVCDGAHRLQAIADLAADGIEVVIEFIIQIQECADEAELARLYRISGETGKSRTLVDAIRTRPEIGKKYGIADDEVVATLRAAAYIQAKLKVDTELPTDPAVLGIPEDNLDLVPHWMEQGAAYAAMLADTDKDAKACFERRAVRGCGQYVLRFAEKEAQGFLDAALYSSRSTKQTWPRILRNFYTGVLRGAKKSTGSGSGVEANLAQAFMIAWNGYMEKKPPTKIIVKTGRPLFFLGTPSAPAE